MAKLKKTWTGVNAPHYGILQNATTKKKISRASKRRLSNPKNHPMYGKHHSEETKNKISQIRIKSGMSAGKNNPMYGKKHTPEAIRKMFEYRRPNSLETIVMNELNKLGVKYKYQFFITENGVCRSYDFKIKHAPIIIEADGDYWHGNPNTPHHHKFVEETRINDALKEKMANSRGYKVIRFWESDIKRDISIIKTRFVTEGILDA
jgi:very-short-patch-repair endonuclease